MESNHVYSESFIWSLTNLFNAAAHHLYPVVFVISALIWIIRERSKVSVVAMCGAILVLSAKILHITIGTVHSVVLSSPVPAIDQNIFVWFLFLHGLNIGLLIYGGSVCWFFSRVKSV